MTKITTGIDLDIDASTAFALISDPAHLCRWFAEDVSIDPRVGGIFTFAGRGAYAPISTRLITFEPGRVIGWEWPLLDVVGTVTVTVASKDEPGCCRVDVLCHFPTLPDIPRATELIDDLWRFYMGNLKALSEGGAETMLPDFSDPSPEVRQSIFIAAPRASVFRALIDPALLAKWTYGEATVEPRTGGTYTYGWAYEIDGKNVDGGPTVILEFVENEKLVTDWPDWRGDATNNSQKITWLLEDEGKGTRLTLIHDGFVRPSDISDFSFGWSGFLEGIRDAVLEAEAS
jgi:uncharacterized protein YndB with AHSA1/START domain